MNAFNLILLLLVFFNLESRILLFTYAYNKPEFIGLQHKAFKKFLKDDYEYIVFNDATDPKLKRSIKHVCSKLKIQCIDIPQEIHSRPYLQRRPTSIFSSYNHPSVRNCNVVQYSLDNYGFKHNDIVALFDSDIFLTKEFSIRKYLKGRSLAGHLNSCTEVYPTNNCRHLGPHINYLWIGLVFLDMKTLPNKRTLNFNCGLLSNGILVESGGYTYYYLKNNPQVKFKSIDRIRPGSDPDYLKLKDKKKYIAKLKKLNFNSKLFSLFEGCPFSIYYPEFFVNGAFLHYGSASYARQAKAKDYHIGKVFKDIFK